MPIPFQGPICPHCGQPMKNHGLTPRQVEVLALLARGLSNKQIAKELVVTAGTVKAHLDAVYRITHVGNRVEATLAALRLGIVDRELIETENADQASRDERVGRLSPPTVGPARSGGALPRPDGRPSRVAD